MKKRYPDRCEEKVTDEALVLEENRSNITFINKNKDEILKVKVDKCVTFDEVICDWLLIRPDDKEFFIELKGSNIKHAYDQIERSIIKVAKDCYVREKNIYIVMSNYPKKKINTQVKRKYFQDIYKAKLFVERTNYIVKDILTA
jgi:hypothetical protein